MSVTRIYRGPHGAVSFKVYPDPTRREFYRVVVFKTLKSMRSFHSSLKVEFGTLGRGRACCHSYQAWKVPANKPKRLTPECGEIHFFREGLRMRHITHECVHAALSWARRRKIPFQSYVPPEGRAMPQDCPEEDICHAVGNMAAAVVEATTRAGILR